MDAFADVGRDQIIWGVVGLLLTLVVAFVLYTFVGALVFAVFFYYAVRPVDRWLDARTSHPDVSATVALLTVGLPMILVLGYTLLVGVAEVNQFLEQNQIAAFRSMLEPYVDLAALARPRELLSATGDNLDLVLSSFGQLFSVLVRLFVMITVAFYLLRDDRKLAAWFRDSFADVDGAVAFAEGVDEDLSTIYVGNLVTIAATGVIAATVYYGFDLLVAGTVVAYPILLGFLIGISTLVPVAGMKAIYLPYAVYLFALSLAGNRFPLWVPVTFLVVTIVVVDTIPDVFIRSYLSKGRINMGLMLLSYVLGTIAFGWYGVFLGPVVLVLFVHFAKAVLPRLVEGQPLRTVTR